MYERYRAVESIAYHMRKNVQHKTRVRIGVNDIELCTREPNSTFLRKQHLPGNIPYFDLHSYTSLGASSSPPPGRPDRDNKNNLSTSSSSQFDLTNPTATFNFKNIQNLSASSSRAGKNCQ